MITPLLPLRLAKSHPSNEFSPSNRWRLKPRWGRKESVRQWRQTTTKSRHQEKFENWLENNDFNEMIFESGAHFFFKFALNERFEEGSRRWERVSEDLLSRRMSLKKIFNFKFHFLHPELHANFVRCETTTTMIPQLTTILIKKKKLSPIFWNE